MAGVADFRTAQFAVDRVDSCGKHIGRGAYWRLYAIENLFRVLVHSVLSNQLGPDWWDTAVSPSVRSEAQRSRNSYSARPWHSQPGSHDIYFTTLSQLTEIIRVNSHQFEPVVSDIHQWIVKLEQIRLPRNVIGHMNFPTLTDRRRIEVLYADCRVLMAHLEQRGFALTIP